MFLFKRCKHKWKIIGVQSFASYEFTRSERPYKHETLVAQICRVCEKIRVTKVKGNWEMTKEDKEE